MPPTIEQAPEWIVTPVTAPAAGADWTLTNIGQGLWVVHAWSGILTTSAAVANRVVTVLVDDATDVYLSTVASAVQAATLAHRYGAFDGAAGASPQGTVVPVSWPVGGVMLPQGHRMRVVTEAIDANDQWSAIAALVEEIPAGYGRRYVSGSVSYLEPQER